MIAKVLLFKKKICHKASCYHYTTRYADYDGLRVTIPVIGPGSSPAALQLAAEPLQTDVSWTEATRLHFVIPPLHPLLRNTAGAHGGASSQRLWQVCLHSKCVSK